MRIPKKTTSPPSPTFPSTVPRPLSKKAPRRLAWIAELDESKDEQDNQFDIEGIDNGQIVNIGSSFKLEGYHQKVYFQLIIQNIIDYANGEHEFHETAKYYTLSITTLRTVLRCDADRHKFGIYIFLKDKHWRTAGDESLYGYTNAFCL